MGRRQPVQVYVLVTEDTIEENLLATLSAKHQLALAALDPESDVTQVDLVSGVEELRRRLEVLLGAKPEADADITQQTQTVEEARQRASRPSDGEPSAATRSETPAEDHGAPGQRERVAAAGGELLGAVFNFLGQLVVPDAGSAPPPTVVDQVRQRLSECAETDSAGRPRLSITLPDRSALDNLAQTLARLLVAGQGS